MKAKVLTSTASGAVGKAAEAIARALQCKCDSVPPAYPCDKEAVVFIGVGATGLPAKTMKYLSTLNRASARNVAFFCAAGGKGAAERLGETLAANGITLYADTFICKGGLFTAKKEAARAVEWMNAVCKNLAQ